MEHKTSDSHYPSPERPSFKCRSEQMQFMDPYIISCKEFPPRNVQDVAYYAAQTDLSQLRDLALFFA